MKIGDEVKTKEGNNVIVKVKKSNDETFVTLKNRLQYNIKDVELIIKKSTVK